MRFHAAYFKERRFAWFAIVIGALSSAPTIAQANDACSVTPAQAAESGNYIPTHNATPAIGYRLAALRWDPLLKRRWALIATCGHPELPVIAVRVTTTDGEAQATSNPGVASSSRPSPPVVHVGDLVHLWSRDKTVRVELAGIAEQGARIGQQIRVRVLRSKLLDEGPPQALSGVVRGPRDVEIEQ